MPSRNSARGEFQISPLNAGKGTVPESIAFSLLSNVETGKPASSLFSKVESRDDALLLSIQGRHRAAAAAGGAAGAGAGDKDGGAGEAFALDLRAENISVHDRWVQTLRQLIDSRADRKAEAQQVATAARYRVIAPCSVRDEFAAMSERIKVLRPGGAATPFIHFLAAAFPWPFRLSFRQCYSHLALCLSLRFH
eukprot:SAG22_NODE_2863_length_2147_cov_1.537109_2_plen_194_part_00